MTARSGQRGGTRLGQRAKHVVLVLLLVYLVVALLAGGGVLSLF